MSVLPDELWRRIMEIGIETKNLDYKNLCCISISCRRLHRLSADDSFWSNLLNSDFPKNGNQIHTIGGIDYSSSSTIGGKLKNLYKIRYEKDREQKRLAHRRVVLRIESEIAEQLRRIQEIELKSYTEKDKMNKAVVELLNLRKVRQASAALNVWQPEIIRSSQKQTIQQCSVSVDFRMNALEMEFSLCKQQISGFDKALKVEKRKLAEAKERLASVTYHPLQDFSSSSSQIKDCGIRNKRLKSSSNVKGTNCISPRD